MLLHYIILLCIVYMIKEVKQYKHFITLYDKEVKQYNHFITIYDKRGKTIQAFIYLF